MSRILVCSTIKGLTDALKQVLKPNIPCQDVILEETFTIKDRNTILVADNSYIGTILKSKQCQFGFIQGTWAGIDAILKSVNVAELQPVHTPVCRFAHDSFSQLIAEYVIAQVIGKLISNIIIFSLRAALSSLISPSFCFLILCRYESVIY